MSKLTIPLMARLEDIPAGEREMLKKLPLPEFHGTPFVKLEKPLNECRISLLSTAAIQKRDDKLFWRGAVDYRIIPGDVDHGDVVMSHSSVNFDRSNRVFRAVDRFKSLFPTFKIACKNMLAGAKTPKNGCKIA